jgi:cation transport ATPase
MRPLLLSLFLFLAGAASAQTFDSLISPELSLAKIKTSAVCDMCKQNLERAMAYEKGVKKSSLDVSTAVLSVWYNPKKTNTHRIKSAISQSGFDADDVKSNPRAYEKLNDCCKKHNPIH